MADDVAVFFFFSAYKPMLEIFSETVAGVFPCTHETLQLDPSQLWQRGFTATL